MKPISPTCNDEDVVRLYIFGETNARRPRAYLCQVHAQVFTDEAYLYIHQGLAAQGMERRSESLNPLRPE